MVRPIREGHDEAHGLRVFAAVKGLADGSEGGLGFGPKRFVGDLRPEAAAMLLVQEARAAGGDIDDLADEIGVDPSHEVIKG